MCTRPAYGNIPGMSEAREQADNITQTSTPERTEQVRGDVFVRSPRRAGLSRVLTGMGATVLAEPSGGLSVTGMDAWKIAAAAAAHYIPIQELTPRSAPLDNTRPEPTNPTTSTMRRPAERPDLAPQVDHR